MRGHSDIALELILSNDNSDKLSYAFPLFHSMSVLQKFHNMLEFHVMHHINKNNSIPGATFMYKNQIQKLFVIFF